jgi:hypothetical protein
VDENLKNKTKSKKGGLDWTPFTPYPKPKPKPHEFPIDPELGRFREKV